MDYADRERRRPVGDGTPPRRGSEEGSPAFRIRGGGEGGSIPGEGDLRRCPGGGRRRRRGGGRGRGGHPPPDPPLDRTRPPPAVGVGIGVAGTRTVRGVVPSIQRRNSQAGLGDPVPRVPRGGRIRRRRRRRRGERLQRCSPSLTGVRGGDGGHVGNGGNRDHRQHDRETVRIDSDRRLHGGGGRWG